MESRTGLWTAKKEEVVDLHHETIYQYILADKQSGGDLYRHLRHQNKPYRKRYGADRNRNGIPNRVGMMSLQKQLINVNEWVIGKQIPS
jgi:IS30 family transposase